MQRLSQFICKHRKAVLIIALLLLIPSLLGMAATKVNYDILVYLPDDIETLQGQQILQDDFKMGAFSIVILENMNSKDIQSLEEQFREYDSVEKVVGLTDIIGTNIPVDMLPDSIKDVVYKDGNTLILVTFSEGISSDQTLDTITKMRETTSEQCKISGMSSVILDTRNLSNSEIAIYVIIAVILCIIVLQVALDSYFAPFLLLINIGVAIVYNMGSNIFLGEISYITKAISSVLQLGVTMDFAIFLYHSYKAEKEKSSNKEQAMAKAICQTATSVVGSSLTTIAGFLALCSMDLTLGKDIGIVMAKGVLFGLICVITVLPAMLLQFDKVIEKTKHKEILPKFTGLKNFNIKHYKAIIIITLIILPFAIYGYTNTGVYYNLDKSLPKDLPGVSATNVLQEKFGIVSTEVALVNKDITANQMTEMLEKIEKIEGVDWTIGANKLSEFGIPKEALPKDLLSIFENGNHQMIIINSKYEMATDELNHQIDEINTILKEYDENAILAGEGPLMNDLVEIADHDFNSVNVISIAVILVIMIFVLKSASLPLILIGIIEFAIFINMGVPAYTNTILPFVASIVIGTIQLGATIDYAILITTKYIGLRKEGKDKKQAVDEALGTSISSIVTSGLCFFGATFGVGVYSKIEMIGSLCELMSRGAIISMVVVITVLPAFLLVCDKLICKTTKDMKKIVN